jgi:hypothetical protein
MATLPPLDVRCGERRRRPDRSRPALPHKGSHRGRDWRQVRCEYTCPNRSCIATRHERSLDLRCGSKVHRLAGCMLPMRSKEGPLEPVSGNCFDTQLARTVMLHSTQCSRSIVKIWPRHILVEIINQPVPLRPIDGSIRHPLRSRYPSFRRIHRGRTLLPRVHRLDCSTR